MDALNSKQIGKLLKGPVYGIVKAMRGKLKRQYVWQDHARIARVLKDRGLGIREISRVLAWPLGKVSEDVRIGLTIDLDAWKGSRRDALALLAERQEQTRLRLREARRERLIDV